LDLISQFKVTNLRHSKLLLKILVIQNMKNVISLKVRILGSNPFLTREYQRLMTQITSEKIFQFTFFYNFQIVVQV
jgi:hypothetical protein